MVNLSVNLEKHGSDTSSSQEAGSRGSSHLRRLRVDHVRTKRNGPTQQGEGQLTNPSDEELVASPAALEAADPAALVAEPAAPDAELAILEAALEADSPTLEADAEASEAALEAEEAALPPTPKMVVAAEVVIVESPLVMVVAKDEVVMALDASVAEPLSVAESVAEPVAEGVTDCAVSGSETVGWTKEETYDDGSGDVDTSGCLSPRRRDQSHAQLWKMVCTGGAQHITHIGSRPHRTKRPRRRRRCHTPAGRSHAGQS